MIKNLWNNMVFVCPCHGDPIKMDIRQGPREIFYACPKYYPENREPGEKACANHMYTQAAEAFVDEIANIIEDAESRDEQVNLTGKRLKVKGIDFEILNHVDNTIKVSAINKRALHL